MIFFNNIQAKQKENKHFSCNKCKVVTRTQVITRVQIIDSTRALSKLFLSWLYCNAFFMKIFNKYWHEFSCNWFKWALVNFSRIKNYTRPKDSCNFVVFKNLLVLTNTMLHSKTCCYPYLISSHICMIWYRYSNGKFCLRNSWRVKEKKASFFISDNSCSHSTYCFLLTIFLLFSFLHLF